MTYGQSIYADFSSYLAEMTTQLAVGDVPANFAVRTVKPMQANDWLDLPVAIESGAHCCNMVISVICL